MLCSGSFSFYQASGVPTEYIMQFPDSTHKAHIQHNTSLHILIDILKHSIMSRQNDPGAGRTHGGVRDADRDSRGSYDSRPQHDPPRRRSMAIHDMLNPPEGESSTAPRNQSAQVDSDEDRQMSRSPESLGSSRRPSPNHSSHGRHRTFPTSSRTPMARAPRQFRPPYSDEEIHFIWYHRIDLGYEWSDITRAYNAQFPQRQREGFGGIQCKYYRLRDAYNIPRVRNRDRSNSPAGAYGMRKTTGLRYPWMKK